MMAGVPRGVPRPQLVQYNDWRQVAVPAPGAFVPERPVSVVVPYYAQPEELGRTLAALEGQTYPRELFEVVVVDDGSPEPLARPQETPLDVKVVRQEDLGFGAARARNTGVRAAAHDILLFLDADMLPEAEWLAAHARWHHAVSDTVTLGLWVHVSMDGVDAETIRSRPGTLKELFAGRKMGTVEYQWIEFHMTRTNNLWSKVDDLFRVTASGNLGIRREFYELVGGFDESFMQWGGEDTEFGYRACTRGGLLVPVREAFAWHQGPWEEGRAEKKRSQELQLAKLAHLIAHPGFRTGTGGRTFTVPQYVVTVRGDGLSADRLLEAVERVLCGPMHDLVVRVELPEDHAGRAWLERHLGPDPRVRVAPSRSALEEFPASAFHVTLPAGKRLHADVVRRLRAGLGTAVVGQSEFPDGSRVSIVRAWVLHRALRTPWEVSDFGDVVTIPPRKLRAVPVPAGPTVREVVIGGKLHIAFMLASLNVGGGERIMLNLARSLIERGHRVDLVLPRFVGDYRAAIPREMRIYRAKLLYTDRKFLREVRRTGVEVEALAINPVGVARAWRALDRRFPDLSGNRRYHVYTYAYMTARYIREVGPDLVAAALPGANSAAVCAAELTDRAVPIVIGAHNNVTAEYTPQWQTTARVLYPLADAVVAVSRGVGESVRQSLGMDAERIRVIYNGVPTDRIRRLAEEEVAHPWFGQGEPPVIISVGREAPAKDYPTLVTAFGLARREVEARLLILGPLTSRYRARLGSLAAGHGVERDVGFVDFDENPYRYMRRSGLFALASYWEGLPTVILEALACGTPVASTDTPYGPREILGCWGELPPVGDAAALGRAMVAALRGERPSEEALRARAADFSDEKAADAYAALFERLVQERRDATELVK